MTPERIAEIESLTQEEPLSARSIALCECLDEIERLFKLQECGRHGMTCEVMCRECIDETLAVVTKERERLRKALEIIELNTRKPAAFDGDYNQIHGVAEDALR